MDNIRKYSIYLLSSLLLAGTSCTDDYNWVPEEAVRSNDGDAPEWASDIPSWDGETAKDASLDAVGTSSALYHENNSFTNVVTVTYADNAATVETSNTGIISRTTGAYVTIDLMSNGIGNTEVIIKGRSNDGGLKLYGSNKIKLTMQGVELTSQQGPAINNQCKKNLFVHLQDGTTNRLTDIATYGDDNYYLANPTDEDRKGCLFSEGSLVFSGTGTLVVAGKYRHAIATDSYVYTRPGVTIAVTESAKNAIHAKGDVDDNMGVYVQGGLIYADISSPAGKGIKTDLHVDICGGELLINTEGNGEFDTETGDTSSPAAIKADGNITISGGEHLLRSSGSGGKGINATGNIVISGGKTTAITTGVQYIYSEELTASPKGVKADGNITVSGGSLNISATGKCDGSEGFESKNRMTISGGDVYVYSYDDAVNATTDFSINGGRVYAYSCNNDGIDVNGKITVSGGLLIGVGAGDTESGIDVDNGDQLTITGGTVIGFGGTLKYNPAATSTQRWLAHSGFNATKGDNVAVLTASGSPVLVFTIPRTINASSLLFSSPSFTSGATYTLSSGGTVSESAESWNGWYSGGKWAGGSTL